MPEGNNQSQETASELPDVSSELPSWRWWTARVLSVNQRLLARSAASLRSALQTVMPQVPMLAISMHALSHAASPATHLMFHTHTVQIKSSCQRPRITFLSLTSLAVFDMAAQHNVYAIWVCQPVWLQRSGGLLRLCILQQCTGPSCSMW